MGGGGGGRSSLQGWVGGWGASATATQIDFVTSLFKPAFLLLIAANTGAIRGRRGCAYFHRPIYFSCCGEAPGGEHRVMNPLTLLSLVCSGAGWIYADETSKMLELRCVSVSL